jgi:hypothetical protein
MAQPWKSGRITLTEPTIAPVVVTESISSESHTPKVSRSERRRSETHQRLLDPVRELVAEHGPDGFTVSEIAEVADVGVGTVYNHFENWRIDPIVERIELPDDLREKLDLADYLDVSAPVLMTMTVSHCVRTARDAPLTAQML